MSRTKHKRISQLWDKASGRVLTRFGLSAYPPPKTIREGFDESNREGGHYNGTTSTLVITASNPCVEGLILRECFISAMHGDNCEEAVLDVASEFAYQELSPQHRRKWMEMWKDLEVQRIKPNLVYAPIADVRSICRIGGKEQLHSLVRELLSRTRYGIEFEFAEYAEFLVKKVQTLVVRLSKTEVKVLDSLLRTPETTIPMISEKLGFSRSWTSNLISSLKEKEVIFQHEKVPFSKIGIKMFHLLLSNGGNSKPFELFSKCPFLYEIRHVIAGQWNELATLTVPSNPKSIDSLEYFRDFVSTKDAQTELFEIASSVLSYSFNFYDLNRHRWEIPWMTLKGWGRRIERDGLEKSYERIDIPTNATEIYLDKSDMQILASVHKKKGKARNLRRELSIGQNKLYSHLRKLRENGLIVQWWNVYNIGLDEWAVIQAPAEYSQIVEVWARELPRVFIRYDAQRNLFMLINLPRGDTVQLMKTLVALDWNKFLLVAPLDLGLWGHWGFPLKLWNVERQSWDSPEEEIDMWKESLKVQSRQSSIAT
jgi:predicted transcriptional regulator